MTLVTHIRIWSVIISLQLMSLTTAAPNTYYLPSDADYLASLQTPDQRIGHQVGEFHARHDQVVAYMHYLAEQSDRTHLIDMGKTWEKRSQVLLAISSPENIAKLKQQIANNDEFNNDTKAPLVVWLGFSIHGNEASGTNASLFTSYHLTALQGAAHEQVLQDTIIFIEPSLNPDGYGRFSTFVNSQRSLNLATDPMDREHQEPWPNGRTNHYRFDLNRDWLLATQKESQNRLKWYQHFQPNVFGDFHEMGTNSTYFFQPGVPERQNPLTPEENFNITDDIAQFHAKALDNIGTLYYSKEDFDDFYYGKGSTYPDIQGNVGILFEQASSRGHLQESVNGPLSFPFAIRNQFTTSLSTVAGAHANKDKIKDYRQKFFAEASNEASNDRNRGIVISAGGDAGRMAALIENLLFHKIKVYRLKDELALNGKTYKSGILIPFQQRQYRLIKAMFETRTLFEDNTFYDVSTWNFGHAFNMDYDYVERRKWKDRLLGDEIKNSAYAPGKVVAMSKLAYVIDWAQFTAPKAAVRLLESGIELRTAKKPFSLKTSEGVKSFAPGSLIIPLGIQSRVADELYTELQSVALDLGLNIDAINSGYAVSGIDLGSPEIKPITLPRVLLLAGTGVSAYDSGELWHFADNHLDLAITQANLTQFASHSNFADLSRYSHIVMPHGRYDVLNEKNVARLSQWVEEGGVLIGMKSANKWLSDHKLLSLEVSLTTSSMDNPESLQYSDMSEDNAQKVIGGSIFDTKVDLSHPLTFGIGKTNLSVFKNHRYIIKPSDNPYLNIIRYTEEPLVSGYVSSGNLDNIANSVQLAAERKGRGSVIAISDNPVFRAYWYGSSRLFVNALFLGTVFERPNR